MVKLKDLCISGALPKGADQFSIISDNVVTEETLEPSSTSDFQLQTDGDALGYDLDAFVNRVIQCAELMSKADRFEAMGPLYRSVTPILEQMRDYEVRCESFPVSHSQLVSSFLSGSDGCLCNAA